MNLVASYAYSRSIFDIRKGLFCTFVVSVDICFINFSMFSMCGLFLLQLSFGLLELIAIFSDLSFFTVITTGDTKQSSSKFYFFFYVSGLIILLLCFSS